MAMKVVELGDADGIVTVSVTGEPQYNSTNGIFSAVILSTTGHTGTVPIVHKSAAASEVIAQLAIEVDEDSE
jgi:hypothetical protein